MSNNENNNHINFERNNTEQNIIENSEEKSYSIIPSKILYSKDLKANEKLLYAVISSLANKKGYCYATNKYLANKMNAHPKTISSWISSLCKKRLIREELIRDENKRVIQRKIYINVKYYPLNKVDCSKSKSGQGINQIKENNNIINNIIKNNKYCSMKNNRYIQDICQRNYDDLDWSQVYANNF